MLFLLKDGTYVSLPPDASDKKIAKKYELVKNQLAVVLLEASSRLRSDCYVIVEGKEFTPKVEPFSVQYSFAYSRADDPISESNTVVREMEIEDIYGKYAFLSLMNQISSSSNTMQMFLLMDVDPMAITLLNVTICTHRNEYARWDGSINDESISDWLYDTFNMRCYTDVFLDASVPRNERFDKGHYHIRHDVHGARGGRPEYFFYERKAFLYIGDMHWGVDVMEPNMFIREDAYVYQDNSANEYVKNNPFTYYQSIVHSETVFVGNCMTHTGLIYLAPIEYANRFCDVDGVDIYISSEYDSVSTSILDDFSDKHAHHNWPHHFIGQRYGDMLYLALYIPQYIDIAKYLYNDLPSFIAIEILENVHYQYSGMCELKRPKENMGIDLDLFVLCAQIIMTHRRKDISISE